MALKPAFDHLFTVDEVTLAELSKSTAEHRVSASVERIASIGFWIVVVSLVGTRVALFDPLYGPAMSVIAGLSHALS